MKTQWWKEDETHSAVFSLAGRLKELNSNRVDKLLYYTRMYANSPDIVGLDPINYGSMASPEFFNNESDSSEMRINVLSSVVDTLHAKISKNQPKIRMLPFGGDWELDQRSKKLEQFVKGAFASVCLYEKTPQSFLDGCIGGTGAVHVFMEDGNLAVEKVPPHELSVDPQESMYAKPRTMLRTKHVDREVLLAKFPKNKMSIEDAGLVTFNENLGESSVSDMVTVIETWHLRSGPKAKDGKHSICIENATLVDETYLEDDFPFVMFRWKEPVIGFWGTGVVHEIVGLQKSINTTDTSIEEAHHKCSNPFVMVKKDSDIPKSYIQNKVGTIIPYKTVAPTIKTFQSVNPEIYAYQNQKIARAYELVGVSEMSAASKNVLGPNASGTAIRELSDVESERFAMVSKAYENFHIKIAKKMIHIARQEYANKNSMKFNVNGKKFIDSVEWSEVDMKEDQYELQPGAASVLPDSSAGRRQAVNEMLEVGAINLEEWRFLLDIPDLDSFNQLQRGPQDYIKEVVGDILHKGIITEPEKYDDLVYAKKYALMSYGKAKLNKVPEDRLDLLRQYIEKIVFFEEESMRKEQEQMIQQQQMAASMEQSVEAGPVPGSPQLPNTPIEPVY